MLCATAAVWHAHQRLLQPRCGGQFALLYVMLPQVSRQWPVMQKQVAAMQQAFDGAVADCGAAVARSAPTSTLLVALVRWTAPAWVVLTEVSLAR